MRRKFILVSLLLIVFTTFCYSQNLIKKRNGRDKTVNKIMSEMTLRQMVGQLIMIGSDSDTSPKYVKKIMEEIDSNQVGGVCFFKGESQKLKTLVDKYNSICKIPLMVSIDGEWGVAMRLTDVSPLPRAMTLGALSEEDYSLVYDLGQLIAKQCNALGIHINFEPDIDINLTPANPVINTRSFGQDKYKVALLGEQYAKGMQDAGVMAVIKHFPGHGDTDIDSHKALPTINHDKDFIDSVDIYPFVHNIKAGAWGAMIAHLNVPALNKKHKHPASINPDIIKDYLINTLHFRGLVFTDAMNMKGLTNDYPDGQAQVLALKAGVDILLMPDNTSNAMNAILEAVEKGTLSKALIKEKCRKVLNWKYDMGILAPQKTKTKQPTIKELNKEVTKLNKEIASRSITLLKNDNNILPLNLPKDQTIGILCIEDKNFTAFESEISTAYHTHTYFIDQKTTPEQKDSIFEAMEQDSLIITLVAGGVNQTKKVNYGFTKEKLETIAQVQELNKSNILVLFANPYTLESLDSLDKSDALIVSYQNMSEFHLATARSILGINWFNGHLPVSGSEKYPLFSGITERIENNDSSIYEKVKENGMNVECFEKIDSIINEGLKQKAYPGAQVLIAKDGNIVFERNVGTQTYENDIRITDSSVFDLASLTKVMATTLAVMKLYEDGTFSLDDKLSKYLPYLKKTNKAKITIKEALAHTARLKAFMPFWKHSLEEAKKQKDLYAYHKQNDSNYIQVCDSLFIKKDYKKTIRKEIASSPLIDKHKYLYSDLGFIILGDLVEELSGKSLDLYLQETFYTPMGLTRTTFNPIAHNQNPDNIVPSIEAIDFRKTALKGYVHDEAAALNGGIAGHAGLFSNAGELFAICQMLLDQGEYQGQRYLKAETIKEFNKRHFEKHNNRRGLGFDKPLISSPSNHCSKYSSQESFGHSGFTGTYFWIEPQNNTIFIFLSNRVYPDAKTNKLAQMNIRTDIQDLIYESLKMNLEKNESK